MCTASMSGPNEDLAKITDRRTVLVAVRLVDRLLGRGPAYPVDVTHGRHPSLRQAEIGLQINRSAMPPPHRYTPR